MLNAMKQCICLACIFAFVGCVTGQDVGSKTPAASGQAQQNAPSTTGDAAATSGEPPAKPTGAKGTTLIGCLAGPDSDGKFQLYSMQHRTGIGLLGPDDMLKKGAASKVKLTGSWQPAELAATGQSTKPARKFQVTDVEVLSEVCQVPLAETPVSKQKKKKATGN